MRKVAVVGGGVAGTSAAMEAAREGASVTLFDDTSPSPNAATHDLEDAGVSLRPGVVEAIGPGPRLKDGHGTVRPDSLVVATGSCKKFPRLLGIQKQGVHLLRSREDLCALVASLPSVQFAIVWGDFLDALAAADKIRGRGREVTALLRDRLWVDRLSPTVYESVASSAASYGVRVSSGAPERVVGADRAEAVTVGGTVFPCDALVVLPSSAPRIPTANLATSSTGGLLVDRELRTSAPDVFAAGSCAELVGPGTFERPSPSGSGFVAGANAAGRRRRYLAVGSWSSTMFGLTLSLSGLSLREARRRGHDAVCVERSWGARSSCAVIFDSRSSKVLGVQLAGEASSASSGGVPMFVPDSLDLATLAVSSWGNSTDISPVSETARQGLRWGGTSHGQGDSLRPRRGGIALAG